jgi:hypothetical protein
MSTQRLSSNVGCPQRARTLIFVGRRRGSFFGVYNKNGVRGSEGMRMAIDLSAAELEQLRASLYSP